MRLAFRSVVAFSLTCCILFTGLVFPESALANNMHSSKIPHTELHQDKPYQERTDSLQVADAETVAALGVIAATTAAATSALGTSLTVATVTSTSTALFGLAGLMGATATTVVALPVAGVVGVTGLVGLGAYKVGKHLMTDYADTVKPVGETKTNNSIFSLQVN